MPLPVFFAFDNSYARDLEGLYVPWKAVEVPQPKLVKLNHALATELGWTCRRWILQKAR